VSTISRKALRRRLRIREEPVAIVEPETGIKWDWRVAAGGGAALALLPWFGLLVE